MRTRASLVLVVLGVLGGVGCVSVTQEPSPQSQTLEPVVITPRPEPPPTEPTPLPETVEPSTTTPSPTQVACEVQFITHARDLGDGRIVLLITARNQSGHPVSGTLVRHCPGPVAHFRGLPEHYILGNTCTMGACPEDTTEEPFSLADGESRNVAQVQIATRGDSCNAAIPDGAYNLGGSVELRGIGSCVVQGAVVHVGEVNHVFEEHPTHTPPPTHERCPPVACAYSPCPPGVSPPAGCAGQCGCVGTPRTNRELLDL